MAFEQSQKIILRGIFNVVSARNMFTGHIKVLGSLGQC